MKFNKVLIGLAALAVSVINLQAIDTFNSFSTAGTAINAGTNYAIIPGEGFNNPSGSSSAGNTVLNFLNASGLSTNAITLTSYYSTNRTVIISTNSLGVNNGVITTGGTTNYVVLQTVGSGLPAVGGLVTNKAIPGTNGFTVGTICVLHHGGFQDWRVADEYEVIANNASPVVVTTNAAGSVITLQPLIYSVAPTYPCLDGDELYAEVAGASISMASSATTPTTIIGPGILSGGKAKPFLLYLVSAGAGSNTINAVNAVSQ